MKTSFELSGFEALDAAWRQAPEMVREELMRSMVEADELLEREVKDLMPTATGLSRASIFSREQALPDGALGVVGTAQPHVAYLELGTRPHFPPVAALEDWVRVKFGYIKDEQIHSAALAIARKIAARGTLGVGMFHRSFARLQPNLIRIFAGVQARIAARLAGGAA